MSKSDSETVDPLLLKYSIANIKQEIALAQPELVLKPNCRFEDCKKNHFYNRHILKTFDTTELNIIP